MATRADTIWSALEASGAAEELTDDQRRDIVERFETLVNDRIAGGAPENQAVAHAVAEMVRELAPPSFSAWRLTIYAWAMLFLFIVLQVLLTPRFAEVYEGYTLQRPFPTEVLFRTSEGMRRHWLAVFGAVAFLGWALICFRPARPTRPVAILLVAASALLLFGLVVGLSLPLIAIQHW